MYREVLAKRQPAASLLVMKLVLSFRLAVSSNRWELSVLRACPDLPDVTL